MGQSLLLGTRSDDRAPLGAGPPMGYVDKNLMAGEEILLRPRYHPVRFVPGALGIFLGVLVALSAVVLPPGTASPGPSSPWASC